MYSITYKKSHRKQVIQIKRILSLVLCLILAGACSGCSFGGNKLKLVAANSDVFKTVKSDKSVRKDDNWAYLEIAVNESAEIIAKLNNQSVEDAKKTLYSGGYTVYTSFDKQMNKTLTNVCEENDENVEIASAITDLNGNLVAVYSTKDKKNGENFATALKPPCSSIKPLSVYAPAIDEGIINWGSRYEDSAYKQITSLEGIMRPWPKNATNIYTKRYVYIYQAIKESLNTVAVKCLADYGVDKSVKFLEDNFSIDLLPEKTLSASDGEEEIIGNIALGSLTKGVSVVDMAGYYQIFANGGLYETPKTVLKICDPNGKVIYNREYTKSQVINPTTAELMNRMLKEVVSSGGTGEKAACSNVEVAGKTGTNEHGTNNWFVGVTPEYSCAVWHGSSPENIASGIFSQSVDTIYGRKENLKQKFTYRSGLVELAYCNETGKQISAKCPIISMGYFTMDNMPGLCDRH